ncbi:hypothetical protein AAG570_000532 [Ranatra chinensis]|uniref:Uncharacterized protein n=1 Tax=Ranatra chinensis TaxID=642074 RepID=A0ABD0ZA13_9HEMI
MDYKARLKELRIYGISSYRISDIIIDRSEGKATVKLDVPVVRLGADYEVKGSYLGEPIQGSGRFNTNLTKFSVDITIKVNATDVETEECCRMKETEVAIQMATGRGYFSDMYTDAYTEPSKATNSFLEAHALDILREVKPAVESIISLLVEEIGNRIETFTPHYTIFRRT